LPSDPQNININMEIYFYQLIFKPKQTSNRNISIVKNSNLEFEDFEVSIDFRDVT
jgi:hypothetical protein